jgi:hypothetical protein
MLYSIETNSLIRRMPHEREFNTWRSRLTDEEFQSIVDELNRRVDGNEVKTSSWIPGSNWTGTVWEPIYTKACNGNATDAAMCFGLFMWFVMQNRPDTWSFGHYSVKNVPVKGLTYFQVHL